MKTSSRWNFRSTGGKIMMGLVLAAMIGSINVAPSYGDDNDRGRRHDRNRYENRGHGNDRYRYERRGHGNDRYRYDHSGRRYYYLRGKRVYRPYGYSERFYAPPPVYYEPPPPPGISIFFPF